MIFIAQKHKKTPWHFCTFKCSLTKIFDAKFYFLSKETAKKTTFQKEDFETSNLTYFFSQLFSEAFLLFFERVGKP